MVGEATDMLGEDVRLASLTKLGASKLVSITEKKQDRMLVGVGIPFPPYTGCGQKNPLKLTLVQEIKSACSPP